MRAAIVAMLLGPLASGCYRAHAREEALDGGSGVRRDGSARPADAPVPGSDAGLPAGSCWPLVPDEWITPAGALESVPIGVRVSEGVGCGCVPRIRAAGSLSDEIVLEACDCSDDDCVDPGYEAAIVLPREMQEEGVRFVERSGGTRSDEVDVWQDRAECGGFPSGSMPALLSLAPRAAAQDYVRDGDPPLWVHLTWQAFVCCGPPDIVVRGSAEVAPGRIELDHTGCFYECECPRGREPDWVTLDTDLFAGFHAPGRYTVAMRWSWGDGRPDVEVSTEVDHR